MEPEWALSYEISRNLEKPRGQDPVWKTLV